MIIIDRVWAIPENNISLLGSWYDSIPMIFLNRLGLFFFASFGFSAACYGTDWSQHYDKGQAIHISIGQIRNYSISIETIGGGTMTYPPITGKGTNKDLAVGPGTLKFHVKYEDDNGNYVDPALAECPGPSLKFSYTSHHGRCGEYNEATILIQPSK